MLTFNEIVTYEPAGLIFAILGIISLFGVVWYGINTPEKDGETKIILGAWLIMTILFLGVSLMSIGNGTVTEGTITPCVISEVGSSCVIVADTADRLFKVCDTESIMKLRINQTRDVVLYYRFEVPPMYPKIVSVKGTICPSGLESQC